MERLAEGTREEFTLTKLIGVLRDLDPASRAELTLLVSDNGLYERFRRRGFEQGRLDGLLAEGQLHLDRELETGTWTLVEGAEKPLNQPSAV